MVAQQRWTENSQRSEMIATVFLTMAVVSLLYLTLGCKENIKTVSRLKKSCWCYALTSSISLSAAMNLLVILLGYVSAVHLGERISKLTIVGIVFALAGIVALSL